MIDFRQTLAHLRPEELKLVLPQDNNEGAVAEALPQDRPVSGTSRRGAEKRRSRKAALKASVATATSKPETESGETVNTEEKAAPKATPADPLADLSKQEVKLPEYRPPTKTDAAPPVDTTDTVVAADTAASGRRRKKVDHVWPAVGSRLTASYFGQAYTAEIVSAIKRVKSGRQVRLLDGPARGQIFDTLSEAMLAATERQRQREKRGRSGVSNGWQFWVLTP